MLPQCYPARSDRHPPTPSHKLPQHDRPAGHPTDAQHLTITGKPPPTTAAQPRKTRLASARAILQLGPPARRARRGECQLDREVGRRRVARCPLLAEPLVAERLLHRRYEPLADRDFGARRRRADRLEQRIAGAEEARRFDALALRADDGGKTLQTLGRDALVAAILRECERLGEELRGLGRITAPLKRDPAEV